MPHVLVAGKLHPSGIALLEAAPGITFDYVEEVSEPSYAPLIANADALVIRTQPLSAPTVAMAKRLKIVSRHGVGYDAVDLPSLNERGIAQAQATAEALRGESLAAVYSSDLARARETARRLAEATGAPLLLDAALRERSFGHFQGHTWAEIEARWPEDSLRWRKRDLAFTPDGGESLPVFYERCVGAVLRLAAAHPGQAIAVVQVDVPSVAKLQPAVEALKKVEAIINVRVVDLPKL